MAASSKPSDQTLDPFFSFFCCLPSCRRGGLNNAIDAMGQQVQKAATQAVAQAAANEVQKQMTHAIGGFMRK